MRSEAKELYGMMRAAHLAAMEKTEQLRVALGQSLDLQELCDTIYALKKTSELAEDLRKEVNRLCEQLERQTCQLWVKLGVPDSIRTPYCTGSPNLKQTVKTPKPGTPEYEKFCAHYGVPSDNVFRPHWPSMLDKISEDLAAGKPLPPGCDPNEMWTIFKVGIRKKAPILDEGAAPPIQSPERLKALAEVFKVLRSVDLVSLVNLNTACDLYSELYAVDAEPELEEVKEEEAVETPF